MRQCYLECILLMLAILEALIFTDLYHRKSAEIELHKRQQPFDSFKDRTDSITMSKAECFKEAKNYNPNFPQLPVESIISEVFFLKKLYQSSSHPEMEFRNSTYQTSDVLVLVPTGYKTVARAAAVKETWGKRVGKLIFVSDSVDSALPTELVTNSSSEGSYALTKVLSGWKHVAEHYMDKYKWFAKMDDDTFLFVENMMTILDQFDYTKPLFTGCCRLKSDQGQFTYCSGGAGYILSRAALKLLYPEIMNNRCPIEDEHEDMVVGHCMHNLGITPVDSKYHFTKTLIRQMFAFNNLVRGAVTFHETYPSKMLEYEWLLYHSGLNKTTSVS